MRVRLDYHEHGQLPEQSAYWRRPDFAIFLRAFVFVAVSFERLPARSAAWPLAVLNLAPPGPGQHAKSELILPKLGCPRSSIIFYISLSCTPIICTPSTRQRSHPVIETLADEAALPWTTGDSGRIGSINSTGGPVLDAKIMQAVRETEKQQFRAVQTMRAKRTQGGDSFCARNSSIGATQITYERPRQTYRSFPD
jgi:hypothetical protein